MSEFKFTYDDISKRNHKDDLVVIVKGLAYDLTDFAPDHPGGMKILLKYAGKDATEAYEPIHPPGTLEEYLPKEKHLGKVDMTGVEIEVKEETEEEKARKIRVANKPDISEILSLYDFEAVAKSILPTAAWAYYSSGADDEITMRENRSAYQRIWFRPRVLRDVTNVDFSSSILGMPTSLPVYATATALGRLGHPDGEKNLTWGCAEHDIIQMIPTLASCSFDEIVDAAKPGQNMVMQLYVNKDRTITERIVRHAEKRDVKGLFITVDAPQLGRREKDMRQKFSDEGSDMQKGSEVDKSQGAARAISSFIDPGLSWKDIEWFKSITKMPLILKGVQCWEDAVLAAEAGLAGVVLSNHGGRQLDFAKSGIEILVEVMDALRERDLLKGGFEVYIDGGVRRAGDILKAVALGAKAVGLGRPLLYAYCAYGKEGVSRALQILKDEMEMNLRLIGAPTLADVTPEMVDIRGLSSRNVDSNPDYLMRANYEPLQGVGNGLGAKPRL
ncbi:L-lactate dehydrogenase (cytochrome) [Microbotryum lychnidis-dioicae p1A1 Lamole]|uniref:L-lactate dehydrogenase (cytochrome) n=1 Tax=Microbotryum lychnidis-dioicae (strain p1A1 Lamole / MvSl-1064) TaxID=683840 RepID=U5GYB5_USTV1|nr:L-lactate dehydrogenase (cytochrome) [Microbotryum lychnidis-dioicae p1A1 Lamole]|eukprot:KDE09784.1 L-lactate dehydrogenase (cytochrome) [Microbotryum lychnidis-dioicae p1A1 Lamole]